MQTNAEKKLVVFENKEIRRTWHDEEWFFSIIDIIAALTESAKPSIYWSAMKARIETEDGLQLFTICKQLKLESSDGKKYLTDCANIEGIFRIIQSVPSPKAEPFKRWLAKVGYERIQEIENPELAQDRMKQIYEQKGYSKDWIDKRLRGIAIRQNLTDEWKERGINQESDFAILTAEISRATFGMTLSEYKNHKNLKGKNQNLRDNMTDLELIFTMLGERITTQISSKEKPNDFEKSRQVAKRGGRVAETARLEAEKELGESVISRNNFLKNDERKTKIVSLENTKNPDYKK